MVDAFFRFAAPSEPVAGMPLEGVPALVMGALLQMQHEQFTMLGAWLQSVTAFQADVQQRWLVAWAGGVPLDG